MTPEITFPVINNRYQLDELIGSGSMGRVYRATDSLTGEMVALKWGTPREDERPLIPPLLSSAEDHQALTQEFQLLISLHHPHIIQVRDYGYDTEGLPFYTMDYLDGAQSIVAYTQDQPWPKKLIACCKCWKHWPIYTRTTSCTAI